MSEESKTPNKSFKLHVVNLIAMAFGGLTLAAVFLIGSHMGVVWSEVERVGLIGGVVTTFGGALYSAKKLPGGP